MILTACGGAPATEAPAPGAGTAIITFVQQPKLPIL